MGALVAETHFSYLVTSSSFPNHVKNMNSPIHRIELVVNLCMNSALEFKFLKSRIKRISRLNDHMKCQSGPANHHLRIQMALEIDSDVKCGVYNFNKIDRPMCHQTREGLRINYQVKPLKN